ncbi:unnamed protein product [marine sediment metagenome]|uniref:Uncharacterized protein n=1 Tax=marine sediment metagenome TaxID=412755 RepID=X0UJ54_9ZZZZ
MMDEKPREYSCYCTDWIEGIAEIEPMIDLARTHGIVLSEGYKPFTHCPWCGKELEEI